MEASQKPLVSCRLINDNHQAEDEIFWRIRKNRKIHSKESFNCLQLIFFFLYGGIFPYYCVWMYTHTYTHTHTHTHTCTWKHKKFVHNSNVILTVFFRFFSISSKSFVLCPMIVAPLTSRRQPQNVIHTHIKYHLYVHTHSYTNITCTNIHTHAHMHTNTRTHKVLYTILTFFYKTSWNLRSQTSFHDIKYI